MSVGGSGCGGPYCWSGAEAGVSGGGLLLLTAPGRVDGLTGCRGEPSSVRSSSPASCSASSVDAVGEYVGQYVGHWVGDHVGAILRVVPRRPMRRFSSSLMAVPIVTVADSLLPPLPLLLLAAVAGGG